MNLQKEFYSETGRVYSTIDENDIPSYTPEYVSWLESKLIASRGSRTLSAVPSERDVEKFYNPIKNEINENKKRVIDNILAQREEILSAFISKHGFEPDEAEQIIVTSNDNLQTKWFVRKRGIAG